MMTQTRFGSNNSEFNKELEDAASMYAVGNLVTAFHKYKHLAEKGDESCQSFVVGFHAQR